jgi:hypothetical protein
MLKMSNRLYYEISYLKAHNHFMANICVWFRRKVVVGVIVGKMIERERTAKGAIGYENR